jgi:hypothetical protein
VRRFALAIIVALLTFSASGVSSLIISEPCTGYERAGREDGGCAPTCVACGCCAQAAEAVLVVETGSPQLPVAEIVSALPRLVKTEPRAILHVPKPRLA